MDYGSRIAERAALVDLAAARLALELRRTEARKTARRTVLALARLLSSR